MSTVIARSQHVAIVSAGRCDLPSSQLAAELQEKTKILQNEVDILRASTDSKEK